MRRDVEVYAEWPDRPVDRKRWTCGSGHLLGGRLLLTAAHVVCPAGRALTRIEVRTSAGPVPATVAWWRDEPGVDVALLLITDPAWPQPRWRRPIRWGRFVTEQPGQECQAVGFPDVVAEPRYRESHHAVGVVNPGSLLKSGLQAIEVRDPPGRRTADGSAWAGMSGAAVCSGPLVVGVVALDPAGFDGRRLVATPVAAVVGNPGFADLVAAHCGRPPHLEPVELAALGEPVAEPTSPAGLLRADVATTPFRPRPELDQLREWAHSPEWSSLRLVTGPGRQGKSRLARQLATDLRADQWATVVLADHTTPEQLSVLSNLTTPTLMVLDYAESRIDQLDAVLARLEAAETRTRVLLLARTGGSWRTERIRPSPRLQVLSDDRIVLPLGPLERTDNGTGAAWREAVVALARELGRIDGYQDVGWTDVATRIGAAGPPGGGRTILAVQLDALAALLQAGRPVPATSGQTPWDVLLAHEQRYWDRSAARFDMTLTAREQRRAVATATVWGAQSPDEAAAVVAAVLPGADERTRAEVVDWLTAMYRTISGPGRGYSPTRWANGSSTASYTATPTAGA